MKMSTPRYSTQRPLAKLGPTPDYAAMGDSQRVRVTIARNVRRLRLELSLSLATVGQALGASESRVSDLESGRSGINTTTLFRLVDTFSRLYGTKVSLDEFRKEI